MDSDIFYTVADNLQHTLNILYFFIFVSMVIYLAGIKLRFKMDTAALVMVLTQLVVMFARLFQVA